MSTRDLTFRLEAVGQEKVAAAMASVESATSKVEAKLSKVGRTTKKTESATKQQTAANKALAAATTKLSSRTSSLDANLAKTNRKIRTVTNATQKLGNANKAAGRSMGMVVNEISEAAMGFGGLSPKMRQVTTQFAMMGNSAVTMGASMGPIGVGVAALTMGLPLLITEIASTGTEAEGAADSLETMTERIEDAIKALDDLDEARALSSRIAMGLGNQNESIAAANTAATRRNSLIAQIEGIVDSSSTGFSGDLGQVGINRDRGIRARDTARDQLQFRGDRGELDNLLRQLSTANRELRTANTSLDEVRADALVTAQRDAAEMIKTEAQLLEEATGKHPDDPSRRRRGSGDAARRRAEAEALRLAELEWAQALADIHLGTLETLEQMLEAERALLQTEEDRAAKLLDISAAQKAAEEAEILFQGQTDAKLRSIEVTDKAQAEAAEAEKKRQAESAKDMQIAGNIAERTGALVLSSIENGPAAALDAFAEAFAEEMLLMSLKEAAFAIASLAAFDYTGAAGHAAASVAFGGAAAAAGGIAAAIDSSPASATSGGAQTPVDTGRPSDEREDSGPATTVIHFNAPVSEAQLGGMFERARRESRRLTGRR